MATPIPGLAAQVLSSGETVIVNGGSPAVLIDDHDYYFVSNRTAESDGQSLLYALKTILDGLSSGLSTTWTVTLARKASTGTYHVNVSHNHGSTRTITLPTAFALALGFASGTIPVATATTVVADYPSYYWWTPDMPVSLTGPELFDPTVSYGVPFSAGASQRAPDGTTAYVHNGTLYEAEYAFNGVEGYYLIKPQGGVYTNRDLETFWNNSLAKGRRVLWWRDRDNATGSNAPSEGSATPYRYIEYAVQEATRKKLPAAATHPYRLTHWEVALKFWVTEHGETPLTD